MTLTPKTRKDLFDRLDALNIKHSTMEHPPVFTVAESQGLRDQIPGGHTKNLFLKDKKDGISWLPWKKMLRSISRQSIR
jgi:Ala-tRNA(Pro) deacylase